MHLLELRNIKKHFANQKAVDDISFVIERGSIFGLLGPNGAGKTTLLRIITGIFYEDSGEVLLEGRKFDPSKDVSLIGYMPEEKGLYKKMKIGEQALYFAQLKGLTYSQAVEKVRYWFGKLEMNTWWNKKVEDLSKGMHQKLQFIITVLHEPKLIILDEPFSGLDPVNANVIKDEIFRLAKSGSTIIFSTHRMEQVEEICDHIVLVNKGQKLLDGSVNNIRQTYKENVFSIELGASSTLPADTSIYEIILNKGSKYHFKIKDGHNANEVLEFLIRQQLPIVSFNEVLPSLNDIFIKLVEATPASRQFEKTY
ncbi:MAG TPA: ATP-binding cassette domain-containing protein [Flavipsychrobacter sp.]|nr:ATP-binding cassette domain-containing protein [Flavipsychrobacter sp.]